MSAPRRAGIIAAGEGSRLAAAYPGTIKPLTPVEGRPLIHWVASSLRTAGFDRITVLFNSNGAPARDYLRREFGGIRWSFLSKDTSSSWESFRLVARSLSAAPGSFLISTVDALAPAADVSRFAEQAFASLERPVLGIEAALGLTSFVQDEKPLWAELEKNGLIAALGPQTRRREFATCGLYALGSPLADAMPAAPAFPNLRSFLTSLAAGGRKILGIPLSGIIDVDRPEDLAAAGKFLRVNGAVS